ncbi:cysteine dioxygenase [Pandoraea nosoerga]|uniref:Cysteine dioxygenase n=1 Tax=Pandoraea nosoerga TaxID=2508296 RepID=A0A5E4U7L4_9BURK|nr:MULTISPECIES: cysteine dioxygenase [Pandoraea]MBN4667579.1 cysteine dioxygenase [Pandoraea nosoerga]MBN4676699.1 cysteine dioxygenase [Pandoraea nosoerga]MBN4682885.1 cysteine dioxygenase [Pandoraea nosoerga]MBN4746691.1 cysteine dioxygenase [Pandoraea nosoerga]VVD96047.1 cysteine dioxygenase [Pandoraea nosoerga]
MTVGITAAPCDVASATARHDLSRRDYDALDPLRTFVAAFSRLLERRPHESTLLEEGAGLLAQLVARDDWLPAPFAQAHPEHYQQYLLHCDSAQRFCIVSFVWGPGQRTPIHDHTVWGLIGMLRGAEDSQPYVLDAGGVPVVAGEPVRLAPGDVEVLSPRLGDIHRVSNAFDDRVSVSIHVYGANIGAVHRSVYSETGERHGFVSGYANAHLPNPWGCAAQRA